MNPVKSDTMKKVIGGLYVVLIIILSLLPNAVMPEIDPTADDLISHFLAYFIMMLWYAKIYPAGIYPRLALIFIALGIGLEFLQGMLGTRVFQIIDMVFNTSGVLFAWIFARARFAPAIPE